MQFVRFLSRWASRHVRLAIALIILFEVVNGFSAVLLGATLLGDVPTGGLYVGTALLMLFATGIRRLYYTGPDNEDFRRGCLFGAFLGNFLLFGLIGGLLVPRPQQRAESTGAWGYRRVEVRSDTIIRPDTIRPAEPPVVVTKADRIKDRNIRAGFVGLFFLCILMVLLTATLACSAACSGYGFLAAVVSVLGLGFLAGGIYFVGRAAAEPVRGWGEPTGAERRRNARHFWLTWAVLAAGAGLIHILISNSFRFR